MLVKIEARILIFPGTDFHFSNTSMPPGTFFKALMGLNTGGCASEFAGPCSA